MKLFFGKGEHPDYGGNYEVIIAAQTFEEAVAVLATYQQDEYVGVEFEIYPNGRPIPDVGAVISVSESGV